MTYATDRRQTASSPIRGGHHNNNNSTTSSSNNNNNKSVNFIYSADFSSLTHLA